MIIKRKLYSSASRWAAADRGYTLAYGANHGRLPLVESHGAQLSPREAKLHEQAIAAGRKNNPRLLTSNFDYMCHRGKMEKAKEIAKKAIKK